MVQNLPVRQYDFKLVAQEFYVRFEPRFSFILAHYFAIQKEMVHLPHRLGEQFNTKQRWWDKDKSWGDGLASLSLFLCRRCRKSPNRRITLKGWAQLLSIRVKDHILATSSTLETKLVQKLAEFSPEITA